MLDDFEDRFMPIPWIGCWLWMGSISPDGYGKFGKRGIHTIAYRRWVGPIEPGNEIAHKHVCKFKHCGNPEHLTQLTPAEHRRYDNSQRVTCKRGHEFSGTNLYHNPSGSRVCRKCRRMHDLNRKPKGESK